MTAALRIAHRGMPHLALENTLESFAFALEFGAEGIELDVHTTADGAVVVHHDPALPSGTRIHETSLSDLLLEAPRLPTLQAVCDLIGGRAELFVEIKGAGIGPRVEADLAGYRGNVAIHSFDHGLIEGLARTGTRHRLGILIEEAVADVAELLQRTGAGDLWPQHALVSAPLVEAVHALDGRVIPWTVNDVADIARVRALHVDGICTDDVRLLHLD